MLFSHSWLKELVDIKNISVDSLQNEVNTKSFEVESVSKVKSGTKQDTVFDVEVVKTNRVDVLGHFGFAAEIAALLGKKMNVNLDDEKPKLSKLDIKLKLDKTLCKKFTLTKVEGVEVSNSPDWLKERIISLGLKPINNVVDISNYIMLLTGQPTHAYDADKISGKSIKVRSAKAGEKTKLLDDQEYVLTTDDIVIADEAKIIGLGGVMGGLDTSVTNKTKTILFEAANFNPVFVRRSSWKHNLRTDAASRFEKGLPPEFTNLAVNEAIKLIEKVCNARAVAYSEQGSVKHNSKSIFFPSDLPKRLLGYEISKLELQRILNSLSIVFKQNKQGYTLQPPYWRTDLESPEDVLEDIARITGLERIPENQIEIHTNSIQDPYVKVKRKLRPEFFGMGYDEVYNYSFTDKKTALKMNFVDQFEIANPLSQDTDLLRISLLPNLAKTVLQNAKFFDSLKLFEFGNVYSKKTTDNFHDIPKLGLGFHNRNMNAEQLFKTLKGQVDALLKKYNNDVIWKKSDRENLLKQTDILVKNKSIGYLGLYIEKKHTIALAEIDMSNLALFQIKKKIFKNYSTFPVQKLDLSFVIDKDVTWNEIRQVIGNEKLLASTKFVESYQGKNLANNKKSVSVAFEFQSSEKTLQIEEAQTVLNKIVNKLKKKFNIELRD